MNKLDLQYQNLLKRILTQGEKREERTGTGVKGVFNHQMSFNLTEGFPLLTTKKMFMNGVIDELLWFISGSTNALDLPKRSQKWWTPWADANGELGPTYGKQYRKQLDALIKGLKTNPNSRRHVMTMWNADDVPYCNLPPCHGTVIQFYISNGALSCSTYQRSSDVFIGLPVNIASYALLTHLIASVLRLNVGMLHYTTGDTHLYLDHLNAAEEQIKRTPYQLPKLKLNQAIDNIHFFMEKDIEIVDYKSHPAIKVNISV